MKKLLLIIFLTTASFAQTNDDVYTADIRKFTTEPRFLTELVDHLPASSTVPSPLKFNGYIAGADGQLHRAGEIGRRLIHTA